MANCPQCAKKVTTKGRRDYSLFPGRIFHSRCLTKAKKSLRYDPRKNWNFRRFF